MTTEWPDTRAHHHWTSRQREVLDLLAKGRSNQEIADALGISLDGAKWHVREIIGTLGVESRYEAADYWRVRNGLPARLRRFGLALVSAPALRWLALGGAAVVVGIAVVVAALALRGGDDGEPAAPTTTETPTAPAGTPTPGATPSATPTQETIAGLPVRQWQITAPSALPQDLVLYIEKGCTQCDGPTSALQRVANIGNPGAVTLSSRTLFTSADTAAPEDYISSFVFGTGGSDRIYLTLCSRGYCGGVGDISADAQTTLYHSTDRGITWVQGWTRDGSWSVLAATSEGVLVAHTYRQQASPNFVTEYFNDVSGELIAIDPPAPGAQLQWYRGGFSGIWRLADSRTFVDARGEVLFALPAEVSTDVSGAWLSGAVHAVNPNGFLMSWASPEPRKDYQALVRGNAIQHVYQPPSGRAGPYIGAWIDPTHALGTMWVLDSELPPGTPATFGGLNLPVLVDFEAATVTPLLVYGPIATGDYAGRNYVVQYEQGTFHRVRTGGDCLNLRQEPSSTSQSLGCFADDVLFIGEGKDTVTDSAGVTWGAMRAPGNLTGWAAMEFLVRE